MEKKDDYKNDNSKYYKFYDGYKYEEILEELTFDTLTFLFDLNNNPFEIMNYHYRKNYRFNEKLRGNYDEQLKRPFGYKYYAEHAIQRHLFKNKDKYEELNKLIGYEVNMTYEPMECKIDLISVDSKKNEINLIELKKCSINNEVVDSDDLVHAVLEIITYRAYFWHAYNNTNLKEDLKEYGVNDCKIEDIKSYVVGSNQLYEEYCAIKNEKIKKFIKDNIKLFVIKVSDNIPNHDISDKKTECDEKLFDIEEKILD